MEVQSISNTNKHTLAHKNTKKRAGITLQFALEKVTIRPLWEALRVFHTRIRRSTNQDDFFSLERDYFSR